MSALKQNINVILCIGESYNEKKEGKSIKDAIKVADSTVLGYVLSKGVKTLGIIGLGFYLSLNYFN